MKPLFSFVLVLLSALSWCQNRGEIQVFVNPFIQKFGNLNRQYIEASHNNIEVSYFKKPSFELGITYTRMYHNTPKKAWGWSVGTSWKKDFYQVNYRSVRFLPGGTYENGNYWLISGYFFDISIQNIGLTAGFHRELTQNIRLNFLLHQYFRDNLTSNHTVFVSHSVGAANSPYPYGITEEIHQRAIYYPATVPELNISARIFKNFDVVLGARFKFWSFENYLTIDTYGSFETDEYEYDPDKVLHSSRINSRDMSYYFGFAYNIPVSRPE